MKDWKWLHTFVLMEKRTITTKGTSLEERIYIRSLEADAKIFAELTRNHWDIENRLHWMLDTAFHEDDSLIHAGHAPENFSILRKLAMALLKKAGPPKLSIRRKMKLASYDLPFLPGVLRLT